LVAGGFRLLLVLWVLLLLLIGGLAAICFLFLLAILPRRECQAGLVALVALVVAVKQRS
jgi:hypothetical protein